MKNSDAIIQQIITEAKNKHPISITVNTVGNCIEIYLEDVSAWHDWIKGEGADISIIRAMDDDRIVGAVLPLYKWNGMIQTCEIK